jgi:hypothetical protein
MIIIDKWAGLATNLSPYACPPGSAATQVNVQCIIPGQVSVRPGMSAVSWSSHTGSTVPITTMRRVQAGTLETVLYQNQSGAIYVARGPS